MSDNEVSEARLRAHGFRIFATAIRRAGESVATAAQGAARFVAGGFDEVARVTVEAAAANERAAALRDALDRMHAENAALRASLDPKPARKVRR